MAVAAELTSDIMAGNLRKAVAEADYMDALDKTFAELVKKYGTQNIQFDPAKHLKYYSADPLDQHKFHNTRRLTMEELGLTNKKQISPIGVSDPFPLFTDEAVDIMKMECLRKLTFLQYARKSYNSTSGMDCVMRGYVKNHDKIITPFIYAAWTHPKTVDLISTMAGVDLEVVMDYEIAHVNVGITDKDKALEQRANYLKEQREKLFTGEDSGEDIPAIVGWHHDSYPFVCVLMVSDTSNMIGGETYLRMGDNKVARVSGPQKGSAAVLQGRLIQHLAPKPLGTTERITMVTSYRAKDAAKHDGSVLSTVKPEVNYGSRYDQFYLEWVKYRAGVIKARLDKLVEGVVTADKFDKTATTEALKAIESYLANTHKEMETTAPEWEQIQVRERR